MVFFERFPAGVGGNDAAIVAATTRNIRIIVASGLFIPIVWRVELAYVCSTGCGIRMLSRGGVRQDFETPNRPLLRSSMRTCGSRVKS